MHQFKQIGDFINFRSKQYRLVATSGGSLCDVEDFGLHPVSFSFYCQRGYYIDYTCENNYLFIRNIYVSTNGHYPVIAGVEKADYRPNFLMQGFKVYRNLMIRLSYSGTLLIGNRAIESFSNFKGDQPLYAYRETLRLVFREGRLKGATDVSYDMARVRKNILSPTFYYERGDNWGKT